MNIRTIIWNKHNIIYYANRIVDYAQFILLRIYFKRDKNEDSCGEIIFIFLRLINNC